jgi:hypothetical protein
VKEGRKEGGKVGKKERKGEFSSHPTSVLFLFISIASDPRNLTADLAILNFPSQSTVEVEGRQKRRS